MKVLHVNYSDAGGAAIAMIRIDEALRKNGMDSECLFFRSKKKSVEPYCKAVWRNKLNAAENILVSKCVGNGPEGLRSLNLFPSGLAGYLNRCDADVIHLHWVNAETMSIRELGGIRKPVVWTLHDMWPFCGAEHYTTDQRYVTGYQKSEVKKKEMRNCRPSIDIDRWTFRRKERYWKTLDVYPVTVSRWLGDLARKSCLFRSHEIRVIHNTLDLEVFKPMDRQNARQAFNLPLDPKIILFGSAANVDRRKGFDLLENALNHLRKLYSGDVELVVFGTPKSGNVAGYKTHWLGRIDSQKQLALLYNSANVTCIPSRQETFGQTALESLAAGIPPVAFGATGLLEIIEHKDNGYLVEPYDTKELAKGLAWVLASEGGEGIDYGVLSSNARKKAEVAFGPGTVANQYMECYRAALGRQSALVGLTSGIHKVSV